MNAHGFLGAFAGLIGGMSQAQQGRSPGLCAGSELLSFAIGRSVGQALPAEEHLGGGQYSSGRPSEHATGH
jgi:hypothetical protein